LDKPLAVDALHRVEALTRRDDPRGRVLAHCAGDRQVLAIQLSKT
jgi:hypothetical protein